MIDSLNSEISKYETGSPSLNAEAKAVLENIIKEARSAEVDIQYSIDDAKLPFVLTVALAILAFVGAGWALFNIVKLIRGG